MSLVRGRGHCCRSLRLLNAFFRLELLVPRVVTRWGQLVLRGGGGGGGGLGMILCTVIGSF